MPDRSPRLAVLIDADNIPARHIEAVLDEIAGLGEPSVRRVYGDWSSSALSQWKEKARSLGLVMHQQSANTKGKNASDIGLVIDAMDILHAGKVDGFVLVSSDSDSPRLASRIREDGLQVIGVGEEKTPESLRKVCNRFIFLENIAAAADPVPASKTAKEAAKPAETPTKHPPSKAIPLVLAAMKKIGVEEESYSLGQLGQVLTQLYPDFDSRSYGSAKLSDLLKRTGRFDVQKGEGNHLLVRDKA
ncbi:MAG TPA: NYN domain-containing protein [Tabrizicola sp.]|nr:NYN domain-containing protein [Tabrizicola sp.]